MPSYTVQVSITDALVSFTLNAESLEEAVKLGRVRAAKMVLFDKQLEHIDSTIEVTGVY